MSNLNFTEMAKKYLVFGANPTQGQAAASAAMGAVMPQMPEIPTPPTVDSIPKIMPTPDDDAVKKAKRRSISEQMQRRGRASTILTSNSDALGG